MVEIMTGRPKPLYKGRWDDSINEVLDNPKKYLLVESKTERETIRGRCRVLGLKAVTLQVAGGYSIRITRLEEDD